MFMGNPPRQILVVEDEYILAADLICELSDAGHEVLGPAGTLAEGRQLCEDSNRLAGAVLDISLHGEMVYPLADDLLARGIPFLFATGYDADAIPERFDHIERHSKPVYVHKVIDALNSAIGMDGVRASN